MGSKILLFLTKHLLIIHKGTIAAKLKSSVTLAVSASPIALLLDKLKSWAIDNIEFMTIIAFAIIIDHIIGSILHAFKLRDFTWKENLKGLLVKMGLTVAGYLLFEMFNFILKDAEWLAKYFKLVTNLTVFLYPAGSAFVNISVLTDGKFPPIGWIEKIKKFQTNLNLKEFKGEEDINKINANDAQEITPELEIDKLER